MDKQIKTVLTADTVDFQKGVDAAIKRIFKLEEESRARIAKMEASFKRLNSTVASTLGTGSKSVSSQLSSLAKSTKLEITADTGKFNAGMKSALLDFDKLGRKSKTITTAMTSQFGLLSNSTRNLLAGGAVLWSANHIRKIADEYQNINSRLKLVSGSNEELIASQKRLFEISQTTGTQYIKNAASFAKLSMAMKNQGATSEEVLKINDLMAKSLIIQGASTEEAASFTLQFSQALSSGVLSGEEFRAVMESNSYFASILAKALGGDIAQLRKMSKAQELTSDVMRGAFPKMAQEINDAFAKIPPTTARAMIALENSFNQIIDESNKAADGTGTIARSIIELAQTIDANREGIISLFTKMISLSAKTVSALANIGQSIVGWQIVGRGPGKLDFLEFAVMDAQELNAWLKKNAQEMATLDGKLSRLKFEQQELRNAGKYSPEEIAAKRDRLAAIQQEITAIEEQKSAVAELARASGVSAAQGKSLSAGAIANYKKITEAAKKSAADQQAVQGKALDAMKTKYKAYADEVKRLQDSIANREQSLSEKVRELNRTGMSELGAWRDRRAEYDELIKKAGQFEAASKKAFAAGDDEAGRKNAEQAVRFYEKAGTAAEDLARQVSNGNQVVITQQQALKTAVPLYEKAQNAALAVEKSLQNSLAASAKALDAKALGALSEGLPDAARIIDFFTAIKEQGEVVNQEVRKVGETYTNVFDEAKKESKTAGKAQQEDVKDLGKEVILLGGVWINTYDDAAARWAKLNKQMLSDLERLKKKAAEIKIAGTSSSVKGYATGGTDTTGMFIAGERGRELVVTGQQSRIFNNASTNAILRALQSLPRLATGGPTGAAAAAAGAVLNMTVNAQGGLPLSTKQNIDALARQLLPALERMWKGRS